MLDLRPIAPERPAQLREYLAVVHRGKWTTLAVTPLFAPAGLAYVLRQAPTYRSEFDPSRDREETYLAGYGYGYEYAGRRAPAAVEAQG